MCTGWVFNPKERIPRQIRQGINCAGRDKKVEQRNSRKKIRYAVVGLGHIAQIAVLPAFKHARRNSELTALVSGDAKKLERLAKKYRSRHSASYDQYDELLRSGENREVEAARVAIQLAQQVDDVAPPPAVGERKCVDQDPAPRHFRAG
jgi:hypothetical protein